VRGTAEMGGDYPAIVPMLPTGEGTSTPHLTWSDEPFAIGEATILELAGCRRRYHCPIARTVFLGEPPRKLAETAEVTVEGLQAALDAVRVGAACEEIEAAWRRHIAAHGLEMDSYFFTPRAYEALRARAPQAEFTDAHELVNWVRAVKSDAELSLMRAAARIAERVMRAGIDAVEPGVRQCDAVAAIYDAAVRGVDGTGGDYAAIVPMLPTGRGMTTPHLTWTDEPFKAGEGTLLELAGCHRRYHCPLARTVFLGRPPRRLVEVAAATRAGLEAALAAVRPGVRCEDVEAAWRRAIAEHGLEKPSRIGYSVGLNYPPDWGEHTMSLRPGDTTELEPGMTFHMIVGMWMDDVGFDLSETFAVTANGAECLSSVPRDLAVKE